MIISNSKKFIFIHIPKTAGDSISAALQPNLAKGDFALQNDFQAWRRRVTRRNDRCYERLEKHSPATVVRQQVESASWDSYFKFAFVRHPIHRTVSLYSYMAYKAEERNRLLLRNLWYKTPPGKEGDPFLWPGMKAFLATDSFSGFIRHPAIDDEPAMDSQCDFVCNSDGELIIDFVGKFENLDADMRTVESSTGISRLSVAHKNKSRIGRAKKPEIGSDDIAYLVKKFDRDFIQFDYDF